MIKAILFDYDGVIARTMELHLLAWQSSFIRYGARIKKEDYYPLEGVRLKEVARILSEKYNLKSPDLNAIVSFKEEFFKRNYSISFYDGVTDFVDYVKSKGLLIGIVSAGLNDRLEKTTPKSFLEKFDLIIGGEKSGRGKPYPDPYLNAMSALNVRPEETVVVENAPMGIKAAKGAGAYCIAVCSTVSSDLLREADEIIKKFSDIKHTKKIEELVN